MNRWVTKVIFATISISALRAGTYYVSPTGSHTGNGSLTAPWDLQTALQQPNTIVLPGSLINLLGGLYQGRFTSALQGTSTAPIIVAPYQGQAVTISGFGGNSISSAVPAGTANDRVTLTVADPNVALTYLVGTFLRIDAETFKVQQVRGISVVATRGTNLSCPFGTNTCPAHAAGVPVTLLADTLTLSGSYTRVSAIEVQYSGWLDRKSAFIASGPSEETNYGVTVTGTGNQLVNSYIHDNGSGISVPVLAVSPVIYGNIIQNNGWADVNGIGQYGKDLNFLAQTTASGQIGTNIILPSYGIGLNAFNSSVDPPLAPATVTNNIVVGTSVQFGGQGPLGALAVTGNNFYGTQTVVGDTNTTTNTGLTVSNNYLVNTGLALTLKYWQGAQIAGNSMCNTSAAQQFTLTYYLSQPSGADSDYAFTSNKYCNIAGNSAADIFEKYNPALAASFYSFPEWQSTFSYDLAGRETQGLPTANVVKLVANSYNPKLANLAVNFWVDNGTHAISVDLTPLKWPANSSVTLTNAENTKDAPLTLVASGQLITVPMTGWTIAIPIAAAAPIVAATYPNFGVWRITRN